MSTLFRLSRNNNQQSTHSVNNFIFKNPTTFIPNSKKKQRMCIKIRMERIFSDLFSFCQDTTNMKKFAIDLNNVVSVHGVD